VREKKIKERIENGDFDGLRRDALKLNQNHDIEIWDRIKKILSDEEKLGEFISVLPIFTGPRTSLFIKFYDGIFEDLKDEEMLPELIEFYNRLKAS
jgi:hypothetical protein